MDQYVEAGTTAIIQAADYMKSMNIPGSDAAKDCAIYLQHQDPNTVGIVAVAGAVVIISALCGTCISRHSSRKSMDKLRKNTGNNKKKKETQKVNVVAPPKQKVSKKKTETQKQGKKDSVSPATVAPIQPLSPIAKNHVSKLIESETQHDNVAGSNEHDTADFENKEDSKAKAKKRRRAKGAQNRNGSQQSLDAVVDNEIDISQKEDTYAQDLALAVALAAEEARSPSLSPSGSPVKGRVSPADQNEWETVSKRKSRKPKAVVQPVETDDTDAAPDHDDSP